MLLDLAFGADDDVPLPRAVRLADPAAPHDDAARGEVGCGDVVHQFVDRDVGIFDERDRAVDDLGEVMRRDIRRHADGDTVRAVDKQVGEARREHGGLHLVAVEVGEEIHRLLIEIAQHFRGELT